MAADETEAEADPADDNEVASGDGAQHRELAQLRRRASAIISTPRKRAKAQKH